MINALIADQNPNLKFVKVVFPNSLKHYTYKTLFDVKEGDKAVVESPQSGLTIVDVIEVVDISDIDLNVNYEYKWLVYVVDLTQYKQLQEASATLYKELNKQVQAANVAKMKATLTEKIGEDNVKALTAKVRL